MTFETPKLEKWEILCTAKKEELLILLVKNFALVILIDARKCFHADAVASMEISNYKRPKNN